MNKPLVFAYTGKELRVVHTNKRRIKIAVSLENERIDRDIVTASQYVDKKKTKLNERKNRLMLEVDEINKQLGELK